MLRKIKFTVCLVFAIYITAAFSALISFASVRKVPIYSVETGKNQIALTFNCAWKDEDIPVILETLKNKNIHCTFFLVGDFVERCPDSVKAIYDAGHEIGNHSDTHRDMSKLSQEEIVKDISACNSRIEKLTGFTPELFRAPSGSYDNKTISAAESLKMYSIQWDTDSLDWQKKSEEEIVSRVVSKADNGSIILMHTGTEHTADAIEHIIDSLSKRFSFVTVGELIYRDNCSVNPNNGKQYRIP